jgi:integrase/recombinase XerD
MTEIKNNINNYLDYCKSQKRLDEKTLKAYRIDLNQFSDKIIISSISEINISTLEYHISFLNDIYKPKTVKRKLASIKAFFHYLEYKDIIQYNPFNKMITQFREPIILPKVIPLKTIEYFLSTVYNQMHYADTAFKKKNALRDAAISEILFSTGMRISELCSIKPHDINLSTGTILIYGKGNKERRINIGNEQVISILKEYRSEFSSEINMCGHFFANQYGRMLNDQAVRRMINKYCSLASIDLHITPHMFRHTFATSLLDADVDIRYIQEMLGHSSINITQIYTHVTTAKQREILINKHPRKDFHF